MESITKNRQSIATLRALIERAYGPGAVPSNDDFAHELGHGWFNVAYLLTLADGRRVVMKIAPPRGVTVMTYEHDMMRNEIAALELISARTDVPIPGVHFSDVSHDIIDADWFVMEYVDADNVGILAEEGALSPERMAALNTQLGAITARINAVTGPGFGSLRGETSPSWRETFLSMIDGVIGDGVRVGMDLGVSEERLRALIAAEADSLDEVTLPRLVEWDLWPSNAMVRGDGIVAIIDHERAFWGDPLMEAGFTGLDVPAFGDAGDFMRGYGITALTDTERRRRRLYSLYLVLIMAIETHYRGHEDTRQYDIARAQIIDLVERIENA